MLTTITAPKDVVRYVRPRIRIDVEEFWVIALNVNKTILSCACLFRGTVNQCLFHPRDVLRFACLSNASSIVVVHNHPSGCPEPSKADKDVTRTLLLLSQLVQIPLDDHVIIAGSKYFSFKQSGLLEI
jgi:DNA repair protein RadC